MTEQRKPQQRATTSQVAARRAVRKALGRQRLVIARTSYSQEGMSARVLLNGQYYDVDQYRLAQLQAGFTPADLSLVPHAGGDE